VGCCLGDFIEGAIVRIELGCIVEGGVVGILVKDKTDFEGVVLGWNVLVGVVLGSALVGIELGPFVGNAAVGELVFGWKVAVEGVKLG